MARASQTVTLTTGSASSRARSVRDGRPANSNHTVMADKVMNARVHDRDAFADSFAFTCFISFDLLSMPLPCPTCSFFFHFLLRHTYPIDLDVKTMSLTHSLFGFFYLCSTLLIFRPAFRDV
jgi:hypothetical protein